MDLGKGSVMDLGKDGRPLTVVKMALGWKPITKRGLFGERQVNVDLDASCIMVDVDGNHVDTVWFRQLTSRDGALQHSGDNLTGRGSNVDKETITTRLQIVNPRVHQLFFTVNSYSGETFREVVDTFCRVVDLSSGREEELGKFTVTELGQGAGHNALLAAKFTRDGSGWKATMIGETTRAGRTWRDLMPLVLQHL